MAIHAECRAPGVLDFPVVDGLGGVRAGPGGLARLAGAVAHCKYAVVGAFRAV